MLGGTRAPEQLRAPPRGLLPAAAAPRLLPRCAAPGAGAASPPQLQGRPGRVTPTPPAPLPDPAGRMEPPEGAGPGGNTVFVAEMVKEAEVPQAALGTLAHGTGDSCHSPTAEEEVGIPIPAPGLLQVTERRRLHPLPRSGCLRSPSWTRTRAEQNREKQPLGDQERQPAIVDTFLTVERPKED
uniref:Dysbindin domain containing 1 n=1 Tax=Felis catus TaxID=9685 RepID=A0ABI7VRL9_FELCA